jgi:hypothetical protein
MGLAALGLGAMPDAAQAQALFTSIGGSWAGSGQVRFTNGQSEALKCRAYYTPKDGGSSLGLAIICASASNKIELRAQLAAEGGKISGNWEERTFNAAGAVTGQVSGNKFSLSINGGGFSGSMAVGVSGGSQTVTISTTGIGMTGVNINLSRT